MKKCFVISLLLLQLLPVLGQVTSKLLISRNTGSYGLENNDTIRVFGFTEGLSNPVTIPNPTLYMNEGDSFQIDLWNVSQGAPHTIHLHGLDVDQQNDGVPHLSFAVNHMDHGYYNFVAPHAGTYLYHCHVTSTIHVQAGMYGLIVVRPPDGSDNTWDGGYPFDSEYAWLTSEIDTNWHKDSILLHEHDTSLQITKVFVPDFYPQHFLINGKSNSQLANDGSIQITGAQNEKIYVRVANIGFCANRYVFPAELNAEIIASDGRPLPTKEVSDTLWVFPGERFGVMLEPSSQFSGTIALDFASMNTMAVKNTQQIPVEIQGYFGLEEYNTAGINIFPNPSKGLYYFSVPKITHLKVYNGYGQLVVKKAVASKIDIQNLPSGIYYCQYSHKGKSATTKIVKQ